MLLLTYAFVLANAAVYVPLNSTVGDSIKEKDDIVFFCGLLNKLLLKMYPKKVAKNEVPR